MNAHLHLGWVLLVAGAACGTPPTDFVYPPCSQSAVVAPLSADLVEFLPTIGRPAPIEAADALIADGTVSLARRDAYEIPLEPTWREDPFGDPTWVYEYQSLFFILDALVAHQQTGDDRYLDAVETYLLRWLEPHLRSSFPASWADHVMANRTRILLLAWELLRRRDPTSAAVDGACRILAVHGEHLETPDEYSPNNNHGYFQDEALVALALAHDQDPRSQRWLDLGRERIAAQIEYAVTDEGVHREHSPSYHSGMQLRFIRFAALLESSNLALRIDLDEVVARMWRYIAYAVLPTGRAPLVGDSSRWFGSANTPGITDEARYSLSQGRDGAPPPEVDHVFADSGYAFFRDRWHPNETFDRTIYVGVIAAYFSRIHKHCDDLSVLFYGRGEKWLIDAGFWSYDRDDLYGVLSNAPAGHNVVEVDRRSYYDDYPDQDPEAAPPLLTGFELGIDASMVRGEHRFNPGVHYARVVEYERPARLVVSDELTAEDSDVHDYTLYWHIADDKDVERVGAGRFRVTSTTQPLVMSLAVTASDPMTCEIIIGADDPYQGWVFPEFLEATPAPVIACTQRARDASFRTEVTLGDAP